MAMPRFNLGGALIEGLQAGQADAMRRQQMKLAEEQAAFERSLRPIRQAEAQYGLRGQILGTVETPEDYAAALGEVSRLNLPTGDLPENKQSTAWMTFKAPEAAQVAPSWMPAWAKPEPMLPPSTALPAGEMSQGQIAPEDIPRVQRAAERGLPLAQQEKFQNADIGRQIQLATLDRLKNKDELSQRWMDFQREAKIQGMTEAETQRAFQREMARLGYNLDIAKFTFQKDIETGKANTAKTPNEGQSKAALFGGQIFEGKSEMEQLLADGFNPTGIFDATGSLLAGTALNSLASEKAQLWRQAVDRVTNAALRYESGAAIGEQEAARKIKETVPKYGDSPAVVRSKMRTIEQIIQGLEVAAGPAGASVRGNGKAATSGQTKPTASPYKFTRTYQGATYGRNSDGENWKLVK